jgi:hypothetical protein
MVTNYPQQLTAPSGSAAVERTATREGEAAGGRTLVARAMAKLGQLLCGLRGHDEVLHFENHRVMMRCTSCGHDTPGWEISGHGPRRRYEGDARRHSLSAVPARPHLVLRKSA